MKTALRSWMISLLLALALPATVASQVVPAENPNRVKAAFLRNFAHYVTWPAQAFPDSQAPWHICILGEDPLGELVETTVRGRTEQGRSFKVLRANTAEELPPCQIIFIAYQDPAKRRAALDKLKGKSVLTVGDAPEFLREGGIIRFQVEDRVRMSINLDQARAVSLTIPTRMLEVSSAIQENGVVRRVR
ncbi:MAG: DUF4154 domain-containing protein [Betaproteobacteria bacterium HGW-Betaproteobacteria-4]|nr:MAG: DUF4154 domain-containing protein [Betaproteobacteria bacterium HGW-Betaproteobacteria-4]